MTALATLLSAPVAAQSPSIIPPPANASPLALRAHIPLPGVYGRMDHYGWDSRRGVLLLAALGNNTVEVVSQWRRVRSIEGLEHPQAVVYLPEVDRIAVSSASGKLRFYDAATYALLKVLDFGADANADNMRTDAKLLYVAYGERPGGALAVVDPATMERVREYAHGSHPEAFQLEAAGQRIFVNLPDQEAIGVIDRSTGAVTKWKIPGNVNSHALAFDPASRRIFLAGLQPGGLTVVDSDTGETVARLPSVAGVDDLWFDARGKRIFASGAGWIDVFRQDGPGSYTRIASQPAGDGAGSTSFMIRTRTQHSLYMSWPNMLPQGGSEITLYYVND